MFNPNESYVAALRTLMSSERYTLKERIRWLKALEVGGWFSSSECTSEDIKDLDWLLNELDRIVRL